MQGVQSLSPKSETFLNEAHLFAFAWTFESDLSDLKHEVHQTKRLLDSKVKSGIDRPSNLLDFIVFLNRTKRFSMRCSDFARLLLLYQQSAMLPVREASLP